jgi:colicin import membrane protein
MRKDVAISAAAHAIILVWGTLSFAAKPYKVAVTEAFPIDLVPISEFSQMTAGSKTGAATKTPKPFAEKTGEIKPVENPAAKVVPKNEIKAANDAPPTPPKPPAPTPPPKATPAKATPQPPQPQRDLIAEAIKKEEAKPEPKPKPKPEPQRDEIAEAIKKTEPKPETKPEPKPEPKQAEAKPPVPPKKPTPAVPAFDPHQVMALLDKRTPQRQAAVGDTLVPVPQRGAPNAQAAMISQSELDA